MTSRPVATVWLSGGLGNQCFQFSTLLSFAIKTNRDMILCNESEGSRPTVYWKTLFSNILYDELLRKRLPAIKIVTKEEYDVFTKDFIRISEQNFSYHQLDTPPTNANVVLNGYFQSHLYFESIEPILPILFHPYGDRCAVLDKEWRNIVGNTQEKNLQQYVSMHVRRGDYLQFSHIHSLLSKEYYDSAIKSFPDSSIFVVFSDDISWCKDVWKEKDNFIYVTETVTDYEAFLIMINYCLGGHIIANSTFSWWPAYLNWLISGKTRCVVAPNAWFENYGPKQHSLHMPNWKII